MAIGKKLAKAREGIDREHLYPLTDAVKMVKDRASAKFDETIEIAINLGVDPRHADQMVRGVVTLPNGTGRTLRVGVLGRRDMAPGPVRGEDRDSSEGSGDQGRGSRLKAAEHSDQGRIPDYLSA